MGELAQPIWEFIWKLTTVAGIRGGGGAAILHGQERERQGEIRSKVVGRPQRGTIIRTHVTVSSVVRDHRKEIIGNK